MLPENDRLITQLTVRILTTAKDVVGSGVIYNADNLGNRIYVITAAHCLFADKDNFTKPFDEVYIDIYNPATNLYNEFKCVVDQDLVCKDRDRDVAILILNKSQIKIHVGDLPMCTIVKERHSVSSFIVKGFPAATKGIELDSIQPVWKQNMTGANKFQLSLIEDYDGWLVEGFSGSGVFLVSTNRVYLYGIFTRYRAEGAGKTIYCQYIALVNELLFSNFLPELQFGFLGEHGLNINFFTNHIEKAVCDLGPRYNDVINFRTPSLSYFDNLAKDQVLHSRIHRITDKFLTDRSVAYIAKSALTNDALQRYKETVSYVTQWWHGLDWSAGAKISTEALYGHLNDTKASIGKSLEILYEKQREASKNSVRKKNAPNELRRPYDDEIYWLRQLPEKINTFIEDLTALHLDLCNYPQLIVKGEAGAGKSHLFGDIASLRTTLKKPTLLLLGQHFRKQYSIWDNIKAQLGLSISNDELLNALDNIGKQTGGRLIILIDGLNEGDGKEIWPEALGGFLHEISGFANIGICLSVRSTYWNAIVPAGVQQDENITKFRHEGFKGNEYAALKLFCQHYDLIQPSFPLLAPEFANPLFLQLICMGLRNSGKKKFPEGFHGLTQVFKYYLKSIGDKLGKKREEYLIHKDLTEQAVHKLANASFQAASGMLTLAEAVALFEKDFPQFKMLLSDLIQEGVFIQYIYQDYRDDQEKEIIYFAYERFGEFSMVRQLLNAYADATEVRDAFKTHPFLSTLYKDNNHNRYSGVLEALAILLPEKFGLELFDVYDWMMQEPGSARKQWYLYHDIDDKIMESLKWRAISSVNDEKITAWINREGFTMRQHDILLKLLELTATPGHPFNGDRLHRWLQKMSMPERDGIWQMFTHYYKDTDDSDNPFPILRLIDWAWQEGISDTADEETVRLVGQTIAWFLSVTNIPLRDRCTKAMVNLLQHQPKVLLSILRNFEKIDDMYIAERLYAIAYGCALRMENDDLGDVAKYIYEVVFARSVPPVHLLLRDYCRNIIEYAVHRNVAGDMNIDKVRPPYNTPLPDVMPSNEDIAQYDMPRDVPENELAHARIAGRIHFDIMDWDFGEKDVKHAFSMFSAKSFTFEQRFKEQYMALNPDQKTLVKLLKTMLGLEQTLTDSKVKARFGEDHEMVKRLPGDLATFTTKLSESLTGTQRLFFIDSWMPYERSLLKSKSWYSNFDSLPFRRYIVKRAFELGFDMELHGEFDIMTERFSHYDSSIERIGKKYQRIAFYEALAIAADNYYTEERRSSKGKTYDGPWQHYLRNIDPVFISRREEPDWYGEDYKDDPIADIEKWWALPEYNYWNQPSIEWVLNIDDLPDMKTVIEKHRGSENWLYLDLHARWNEPKPVGKSRYDTTRKEIHYIIHSYLVRKANKPKLIKWAAQQNFFGRWMPESSSPSGLFNRENYWSPASRYYFGTKDKWESPEGIACRVLNTSESAVGEMSEDKSDAHFNFMMPCRAIFEGMKLQYGRRDGEFLNDVGKRIAHNDDPRGLMINKAAFQEFLEQEGLEIVWILLGEKNVIDSDDRYQTQFKAVSGVYYLNQISEIEGQLRITDRQ